MSDEEWFEDLEKTDVVKEIKNITKILNHDELNIVLKSLKFFMIDDLRQFVLDYIIEFKPLLFTVDDLETIPQISSWNKSFMCS